MVKVIENPLAKAEPMVLKKSDIDERKKSPTSIMPKGLLDKLTREEILDLVAYIDRQGDPKHKLFQGGHEGTSIDETNARGQFDGERGGRCIAQSTS